jgi:hypothetical protein
MSAAAHHCLWLGVAKHEAELDLTLSPEAGSHPEKSSVRWLDRPTRTSGRYSYQKLVRRRITSSRDVAKILNSPRRKFFHAVGYNAGQLHHLLAQFGMFSDLAFDAITIAL